MRTADRVAYWSFLACALVGPWGLALQEIFTVLAILAWLTACLSARRWPKRMALTGLLLAWFVLAALSVTQSSHLPTSIKGLQKLLKGFGLFYATAETLRTRERIEGMFAATALGAGIVACNGLIQVLTGADLFYRCPPGGGLSGITRLMSTFGHPNDYGMYAVSVFPVCLVVALSASTFKRRIWAWVVVALLPASLVLTFSRPAALAVAVSITLFLVLKRAWKTLVACGAGMVTGFLNLPESVKAWVASQPSWLAVLAQPLRFEIWRAGWNMVRAHPWLGIGVNMFVRDYARYRIPGDTQAASYGHNHYLQLAAEIGIPGLIVFLAILVVTAAVWRRLARDLEAWVRRAALGMGCGIVAFLTIGLLESALHSSRCSVFFWIWLGTLHGLAAHRARVEALTTAKRSGINIPTGM